MQPNSLSSDLPVTQQSAELAYPQGLPVGSPWPEESEGGDGIRISSLFHSLRRQLLLSVGLGIVTATLVAMLLWFVIPVEFQSESVLRVNRDTSGSSQRYGTISDYMTYKETQATLLRSSFVLTEALRDNEINQLPMVRFDWLGRKRNRQVAWLQDVVRVDTAGESELLRVRLEGKDKNQTEKLLDAVVQAYLSKIVNRERAEKVEKLSNLRRRYQMNSDLLEKRSNEVQELGKQLGTLNNADVQAQQRIVLQQLQAKMHDLDSLRRSLMDAAGQLQLLQIDAQYGTPAPSEYAINDELETNREYYYYHMQISQLKDQLDSLALTGQSQSAEGSQLQQNIAFLERKQEALREELTPRIAARIRSREGQSDMDKQKAFVMQNATVQSLAAQVQRAEEAYLKIREEAMALGGFSGELDGKMTELDGLRKDTQSIRSELQALEIELESPQRIDLLQRADTPDDSNWKTKVSEILAAWLFSFGIVVCGVAYWDFLSKRVNGLEDLTRASTVRVVGSLPSVQQAGMIPFWKMDRAALERAMQVAVDGIRTALLYSRRASQVVLVTSATGQEGRSTVASQLAVSMARAGKRTLLVDGDLRNPQQHLVFGVDARAGLCEMLRGQIAAEQAVVPTVAENVWLLTAGRCDQTALQGLSGEQASRIFQGFREQYDVVIMDSSPVLTSADALLLGQHADAALLSVRRDVSQLPKVAAACDRLTSVGVHVLGAVVNGADVELRRGELNVDEETNVEQPALINA